MCWWSCKVLRIHVTASWPYWNVQYQLSVCCSNMVPGMLPSQLGVVSIGPNYIRNSCTTWKVHKTALICSLKIFQFYVTACPTFNELTYHISMYSEGNNMTGWFPCWTAAWPDKFAIGSDTLKQTYWHTACCKELVTAKLRVKCITLAPWYLTMYMSGTSEKPQKPFSGCDMPSGHVVLQHTMHASAYG